MADDKHKPWRSLRSLCLAVGVVVAAVSSAGAADVVRVGAVAGAAGSLRLTLPTVEQKYDLKIDVKNFSDSTSALLALAQGELEIAHTTSQHLIRSIDQDLDVVMVMGSAGGYNVLVAAKSLNLKRDDWAALKAEALKRKAAGTPLKIGVPTGSMQHAALIYVLKRGGIDADKDVSVLNLPFTAQPRALEGHEIDMAMSLAVFGALAVDHGSATVFDHPLDTPAGKQEVGLIVRRKLIQENPGLVQRIVDAHVAAMKLYVDDVDKQIALEKQYTGLPDAVVAMTQRDFVHYDYRMRVEDIKGMAKELYDLGWVKKDYSDQVDSHVDFTFLEKATGKSRAELATW